ncbi:MAG TPA: cytochrome c [Steroidobacteraceae bacterium]|jgi:mono/diheme cytochrome c family protein|nr:cytochrome c [Steroidobacteraceae bacterium]
MPEGTTHALWRALITAGALLLSACVIAQGGDSDHFDDIQRGRYLTLAADCGACHTDPAGGRPFAGGRPVHTPFGTVVAANITPDAETGIGNWSDAQFEAAIRQGIRADGKRLYPAMPYPYFVTLTPDDVQAIHAYLKSVAPVHQHVATNRLPFPFRERIVMRVWNALYFDGSEFKPDHGKSDSWNRGAYLVQGAGHCGACHTPKGLLGGDKTQQSLHGDSQQGWFAPNITADAVRGIADWSSNDIVAYLKTGHNQFAAAAGPMAEVVTDSTAKLTEADLTAIATYLKDQPGTTAHHTALSAQDPAMVAGAAIYSDLCSACHKPDGSGVPYLIPNLVRSDSIASREPTSLLHVVLHGAQTAATGAEPTAPAMPGFGRQLNDAQVAAVVTYVRNSWGHAASAVAAADVRAARAKHE